MTSKSSILSLSGLLGCDNLIWLIIDWNWLLEMDQPKYLNSFHGVERNVPEPSITLITGSPVSERWPRLHYRCKLSKHR